MTRTTMVLALLAAGCVVDGDVGERAGDEGLQRLRGLWLSHSALVPGADTTVHLYGAEPGETVFLARGSSVQPGAGPCPTALGGACVDLAGTALVGSTIADADGHATWVLPLPATLPAGRTLGLQAAIARGVGGVDSVLSDALEAETVAGGTWYDDQDGDGHGDALTAVTQATPPVGFVGDGTDCDDSDAAVHPGAPETFGNGVDDDCDGDQVPTLDCVGSPVPGAYATLQDAVNALQNVGGTICLGEGTFATTGLSIVATEDLDIIGVSSEHTVVAGAVEAEQRSDRTLTVRGLTLDRGLAVGHGDFVLSELVVRTHPTILTSGISVDSDLLGMGGGTSTLLVDRCDISGSTHAVFVDNSQFNPADIAVTVQDSWLHSDWTNVYVLSRQIPTFWQTEFVLDHNTIEGLGVWPGLDVNVNNAGALDLTYTNNLFEGHSVAVDLEAAATVLAGDHNAFWDNGAAFSGAAVAGPGDVFADCDLDDSTPPVPGPSSPCVDAAASGGPAVDFWGLDRVGAPDIGAVER